MNTKEKAEAQLLLMALWDFLHEMNRGLAEEKAVAIVALADKLDRDDEKPAR